MLLFLETFRGLSLPLCCACCAVKYISLAVGFRLRPPILEDRDIQPIPAVGAHLDYVSCAPCWIIGNEIVSPLI